MDMTRGAARLVAALTLMIMVLATALHAVELPRERSTATNMPASTTTSTKAIISGSIWNDRGQPICGLVLANGVFAFSCSPAGSYSLSDVPLDVSGQITLFGFADGHFPFRAVLAGTGGAYDITLNVASTVPPPENNRTRTERLVGGTWSLTYVIISTFTQRYSFSSVQASTAVPGDYNAFGVDQFGNPIIGAYTTRLGKWAILDPGSTIDRFFVVVFVKLCKLAVRA